MPWQHYIYSCGTLLRRMMKEFKIIYYLADIEHSSSQLIHMPLKVGPSKPLKSWASKPLETAQTFKSRPSKTVKSSRVAQIEATRKLHALLDHLPPKPFGNVSPPHGLLILAGWHLFWSFQGSFRRCITCPCFTSRASNHDPDVPSQRLQCFPQSSEVCSKTMISGNMDWKLYFVIY